MDAIPDAVKEFIREARVCRIATELPSGEPHVIPVCPVYDGDATVYIDIGSKYTSAEGVRANERVAVLIDYYDDNWALLKGVLLRTRAEAIEGDERDRAWDLIREKFPAPTRPSAGNRALRWRYECTTGANGGSPRRRSTRGSKSLRGSWPQP